MKHRQSVYVIGGILAVVVVGTGFLFAYQHAREENRRAKSSGNLKQLWLAMANHHDTYKTYPGQGTGRFSDGERLLSWRVHLLPFMEEAELYERFRLDEPWDSEHNRTLIDQMPSKFLAPGSKHKSKTTYLAPIIKGSPFSSGKRFSLASVTDGFSRTIMFVEATDERAVIWTKPEDFEVNPKKPVEGLAGSSRGGFLVVTFDGKVHFTLESFDLEMLNAHFTMMSGDDDELLRKRKSR